LRTAASPDTVELPSDPEIEVLGRALLLPDGPMPLKATLDAFHIAMAAYHRCDYLLTWNLTHIANAAIARRADNVISPVGMSQHSSAHQTNSEPDHRHELSRLDPLAELEAWREQFAAEHDYDPHRILQALLHPGASSAPDAATILPEER